ncbi:FUK [Branchiostoma lanceolatum]|uniref:L-fucose kinase n=1 Tax=Branchiostoma lanceolatum TaxID=7740 RepID=A0A8K0A611_BRALA|nr:FUK [Branchiostoma lanceolatum]
MRRPWTAIVLTCQNVDSAHAYQDELILRQRKGLIPPDTLLLTVEDPKAHVGSGGATLNALLIAAEHLSARSHFTVVNSDVLSDAYILIMHMGRDFPYNPCGKAFTTLPATLTADTAVGYDGLFCNLDSLLDTMTRKISPGSPPGVWVCSTDMLLTVPNILEVDWTEFNGVCAVTVAADVAYARNHGVFKVDAEGTVEDIVYKPSNVGMQELVTAEGTVHLVAGVVFLSSSTAERLLTVHVTPPLDACTYLGLDSGAEPIKLSLFFDILLCMATLVTEEAFVSGDRSGQYGGTPRPRNEREVMTMRNARALLWKTLRGINVKAVCIPDGRHDYMTEDASVHLQHLVKCPLQLDPICNLTWAPITHSTIQDCTVEAGSVIVNSVLEGGLCVSSGSAVSHCHLKGHICIPEGCYLHALGEEVSQVLQATKLVPHTVLQCFHVKLFGTNKAKVYTVLGTKDELQATVGQGNTFCNESWDVFFQRTGILHGDLWGPHMPADECCLMNAKLFPVFHPTEPVGIAEVLWLLHSSKDISLLDRWRGSWRLSLQEVLSSVDHSAEFMWRRDLFYSVGQHHVRKVLLSGRGDCLLPFFKSAAVESYHRQVLVTLDQVALEACPQVVSRTATPGVTARTLACIADVLGSLAGGQWGLRSGPAANKMWQPAYQLLEAGEYAAGVQALALERECWLDSSRPDFLIRAARHYEGAEQILRRQTVMTAKQFIHTQQSAVPGVGQWVVAECPARIDLSGGWSDTPPITYEHGGSVTNVALLIDGKKPIGAKARRIQEPELVLVIDSNLDNSSVRLTCTELSDMETYCQPHAPGALLKACVVCADLLTLPSPSSLREQLQTRHGCGFELHTWSNIPHGSGLGTSSILAGAILAVLYKVTGLEADNLSLMHGVLYVEQLLTSGGGWQDQVGGLDPAVKIGRCRPQVPVKVEVEHVSISDKVLQALNSRLVLVYTGKTRLARNLLQDVVRNWYARLPEVVANCDDLVTNAEECAKAFREGDLSTVGACMDSYWEQKKKMAPGCEPVAVRKMMTALKPHVYGQVLAGAGGGGFMCVLTKEPGGLQLVRKVLQTAGVGEDVSIHTAQVDTSGITVTTLE